MHIYLNSSRAFWQIPDTNITLMKVKPLREISEAELSSLSPEQRAVLDRSLEAGVVSQVNDPDSLLKLTGAGDLDILSLSAAEIQRKHISRIVLKGRDTLPELQSLLEREKAKTSPREDVLTVIRYGMERIRSAYPEPLEDKFYREIEIIEDIIEPEVPAEAPKKKGRARTNKLVDTETN